MLGAVSAVWASEPSNTSLMPSSANLPAQYGPQPGTEVRPKTDDTLTT